MIRNLSILTLSLGLFLNCQLAGATTVEDIQSFTLENGMKIMVLRQLHTQCQYVFVLECGVA